ncbi:MAG: 50S ribosomal protein L30e [Candidatus Micrarchaeota archaeon]
MDIITGLKRVLKTGKIEIGMNKTANLVKNGKAKVVIISENCPKTSREDIMHYAEISGTPIVEFRGTSLELGEICGKPFVVSGIAVTDCGDVKVKELTGEQNG